SANASFAYPDCRFPMAILEMVIPDLTSDGLALPPPEVKRNTPSKPVYSSSSYSSLTLLAAMKPSSSLLHELVVTIVNTKAKNKTLLYLIFSILNIIFSVKFLILFVDYNFYFLLRRAIGGIDSTKSNGIYTRIFIDM